MEERVRCAACGHVRGSTEPLELCVECGAEPADWRADHEEADREDPFNVDYWGGSIDAPPER
jgi:hypothetical protein